MTAPTQSIPNPCNCVGEHHLFCTHGRPVEVADQPRYEPPRDMGSLLQAVGVQPTQPEAEAIRQRFRDAYPAVRERHGTITGRTSCRHLNPGPSPRYVHWDLASGRDMTGVMTIGWGHTADRMHVDMETTDFAALELRIIAAMQRPPIFQLDPIFTGVQRARDAASTMGATATEVSATLSRLHETMARLSATPLMAFTGPASAHAMRQAEDRRRRDFMGLCWSENAYLPDNQVYLLQTERPLTTREMRADFRVELDVEAAPDLTPLQRTVMEVLADRIAQDAMDELFGPPPKITDVVAAPPNPPVVTRGRRRDVR